MWHGLAKVMVKEKTGGTYFYQAVNRRDTPLTVGQGVPPRTAALVPRVVVTSFDEDSSPGPAPIPQA